MADTTWTADRRIYLNSTGQAVEADDPDRQSLLVPAGGRLPLARARALGLTDSPASNTVWAADRRIYVNADGLAVEEDDPTRETLLVAAGGTIPRAEAERLGLAVVEASPEPETEPAPVQPKRKRG